MARGTGLPVDGVRLRAAREAAGLSQRQLAEHLGTTRKRVILYEQGAERPETRRLAALARAVGASVADIVAADTLPPGLAGLRVEAGLTLTAAAAAVRARLPSGSPIACSRPALTEAERGTLPPSWAPPSAAATVRDALTAAYSADVARVATAWEATFPTPTGKEAGVGNPAAPEAVAETTPPAPREERPQQRRAREAWQRLNLRQRAHLIAIFNADQIAEGEVASRRRDWLPVPPATEWRWQHFSTEAPRKLVGYTEIQIELKSQGLLSQGSGSTLAKLRRAQLIEETSRTSPLGFPKVMVRLTRLGRATARAGLALPATVRTPPGMLSQWLFGQVARLYAAGEGGLALNPAQRVPTNEWVADTAMVHLDDRRIGGAFISYGGRHYTRTVALTPRAVEHYERCWSCYRELYPDVWAPDPRQRSESAHAGLEAHRRKRPKGLLSRPQWRVLTELHRVDALEQGRYWIQGSVQARGQVPHGLQYWQIKELRASPKAAEALGADGTLVAAFDLGPLLPGRSRGADPVPVWHITPAGREHVAAHHRTYADLYPDIDDPTTDREQT